MTLEELMSKIDRIILMLVLIAAGIAFFFISVMHQIRGIYEKFDRNKDDEEFERRMKDFFK